MAANRIQIQNALHKPYDRVLFAREVLKPVFGSGFTFDSSLVPASVSPNKSESAAIANVWIYGKIQLDDSTEITCYEVLLQPKVRIEQSKVAIQQYVRKLLTAGQAALINFIAPANENIWRLTLVAKDSVLTEKGVEEKITNAKRYTFLLGPSETCKTAAERLETLSTEKNITFKSLENAFSVEKLSNSFFDEYTLHYQNFCNYLQESNYRKTVFNITFPAGASKQDKDKASKPIRDFVKKLLGRIIFLYFVQKKGWLGASNTQYTDGRPDFIKQLFHQSGGNDTFYSNWLTVLFFDTLNKERANDDFIMPDKKTVKVPFLNGGLFDKEEFDEHALTFPPKLFHNPDFEDVILTVKNNGNTRGFLDFLDAYNFTVFEDSPDEHTVAVDPEMLGHIFENLLEDNKDKGAFYTPKEIVHYMCQESLTEYLCTTLQIKDEVAEREAVNQLLKNKIVDDVLKPEIAELDKALDHVKICDPAIGSGAFPMGLLKEIFSIKELIAYETGKEWNPAETKLNIIQNSIYGVDIEKGAVDIARLRFWLSLVVDEEKPKPLPNLDYKIVVGDSLISKFDGEIVEIDWDKKQFTTSTENYVKEIQRLLTTIANKQKLYFNPNNKNKKNLQAEIRNLKIELLINQLSFNKENYKNKTPQKGGYSPIAAEIKHNTERELQIASFDKLINKLKKLLNNPNEPFNHFDWKLDFPEVLNPYFFGAESEQIKLFNLQIDALNKQIDVINRHIQSYFPNYSIIHLQVNVAQLQTDIILAKLNDIKNAIALLFGQLQKVEKNIVKEPDCSLEYKINSINGQVKAINLEISQVQVKLNPNNREIGFDIVIANPPYIDSETMVNTGQEELREYLNRKMSFCKGNWDIYIAFFDMGFHFLNQNGNLVYITPDKWISKPFGYELRKQLKKNFNKIAEAGRKVFQTAKVDSIITFINKSESDYIGIDMFSDNSIQNLGNILKSNLNEPFAFDWLFSPHVDILRSFDSLPHRFIEYGECENACATSDAYKLKEYLKDIKPNEFNPDLHFKVINTGTISKYVYRWGISEMTYLKDKTNPTKKYKYLTPVVDKKKFIKDFNNSYSNKSQRPKIIIKGLTLLDACLDYNAEIIPGKSTLIITKDKINADDLYAILSIINSKLPLFYIKEKYRGSSYNQGVNFNTDMINNLPIPQIQDKVKKLLKSFSNYLIYLLESKIDDVKYQLIPTYFQQLIDGMVYELYFPDLLKKHNREIIKHLGELPEFTDGMSDEQKMKICKKVFDRLNDAAHPVRENIEKMKEEIPEIRIIEGKG